VWAVLLGVAVCAALAIAQVRAGDSAFARRVASGCEELEPCQVLRAEAERRMDACTFFCGGLAAQFREARAMLHRAEERRAVSDHYRERERAEREGLELVRAQKLDEWQRREASRAEAAARDHRERLELERLRQAHLDRRVAEERARRARYFASLGPEGRKKRLKRCLDTADRCDALALELVESTSDAAEKRKLGELNEGVPAPVEAAPASGSEPKLEASQPAPGPTPPGGSSEGAHDDASEASHPTT
jgi:hypothetical protein